jgi:hypothetical protein
MNGRVVALAVLAVGALAAGGEGAKPADLAHGLVLYYPFDKDASDASGKGHHGVNRGATVVEKGRFGGAFQFDGAKSYVAIPPAATEGLLWATVSLWVKTTQAAANPRAQFWMNPTLIGVSTGGWGSNDFAVVLENGKAAYFHGLFQEGVDMSWFSDAAVNDDAWHHIAWVNEGPAVRLYVDGRLVKGEAFVNAGGSTQSVGELEHTAAGRRVGKAGVFLGASHAGHEGGGAACFFRGLMDDVAIWSRALSAEEVAAIAARGAPLPAPAK